MTQSPQAFPVSITTIEATTWLDFKLEKLRITGTNGNGVPCNVLWPATTSELLPFVITTHGATSSKHEWMELDGYTKGGNIAKELLAHGIAVLAMDLHYHGDNNTRNTDGHNVFEGNNFEDFFRRSVEDIHTVVAFARQHPALDKERMGFAGYSLAGMFGFHLANSGVPFKTMVLCVPGPGKETDAFYAAHKNLTNLGNTSILQISAEDDEYIPLEDAKWLFDKIPVAKKRYRSFKSGHSLPHAFIPEVVEWVRYCI